MLTLPNTPLCSCIQRDNTGMVEGWRKGSSCNQAVNSVFKRIVARERASSFCVHSKYVTNANNPADELSCSCYPLDSLFLPPIYFPCELQPFLLNATSNTMATAFWPSSQPYPKPPHINYRNHEQSNTNDWAAQSFALYTCINNPYNWSTAALSWMQPSPSMASSVHSSNSCECI